MVYIRDGREAAMTAVQKVQGQIAELSRVALARTHGDKARAAKMVSAYLRGLNQTDKEG